MIKNFKETNKFLKKITDNLENFSYNKIVANLHEIYGFLNKKIESKYSSKTLILNYEKILIAVMPIIPHFSSECLRSLNSADIKWPSYDVSFLKEEKINLVVQINGKKRALLKLMPNIKENELFEIIVNDETLKKYLDNKTIKRKIFIKDKLFNIIV